jgi:hypothetical protein
LKTHIAIFGSHHFPFESNQEFFFLHFYISNGFV